MHPQEINSTRAAPRRQGPRLAIYSLLYPDTLVPHISLSLHYEPKFHIQSAPPCAIARTEAILQQKLRYFIIGNGSNYPPKGAGNKSLTKLT